MAEEAALKTLDALHEDLTTKEEEQSKARRKIDKSFLERLEPLYLRRSKIVTGKEEPSDDLLEGYEEVAAGDGGGKVVNGIPFFWLTVLRHQDTIAEYITSRDEGALEYLEDITVCNPAEGEGIRVNFHFSGNPYFSSKLLSKQISLSEPPSPLMALSPNNIQEECPPIEWKPGMSLLLKEVKKKGGKKSKGKKGGGGKAEDEPADEGGETRRKPCASFFSFFTNTLKVEHDSDDDGGFDPTALPEVNAERQRNAAGRSRQAERLAEAHLEILTTLWRDVVPNAVALYTSGAFGVDHPTRSAGDEAEEEDDFEVVSHAETSMDGLPPAVRRRVHALQALQERVKSMRKELRAEAHRDEERFEGEAAKLHAKRREALRPGGSAAGELALPRFWLLAMKGSDVLVEIVQRRDEKVLRYLADVRWRRHKLGVWSIDFEFLPNPFLENEVLTKTWKFRVPSVEEEDGEDDDDDELPRLVGTEETRVEWKDGQDVTVRGAGGAEGGGGAGSGSKARRAQSFFHLFAPGANHLLFARPGDIVKDSEAKNALVQVGVALRTELVPHSVSLYRIAHAWDDGEGEDDEASSDGSGGGSSDGEGSGGSDSEDDEAAAKRRPKGRSRGGAGGRRKGGGGDWCGLSKGAWLAVIMAFVVLGELFMFLEQSNFWRSAMPR